MKVYVVTNEIQKAALEKCGRFDQKNSTAKPAANKAIAHTRSKFNHARRNSCNPDFSYASKNNRARTPATANMLAVWIKTANPSMLAL